MPRGGLTLYQGDGATAGWQVGAPNYTGAWTRVSKYLAPSNSLFFDTRGYAVPYYAPIDGFFFGMQVETGKFATELIPTTTGSATRAGSRLYRSVAGIVDANRLSLEFTFTAKSAIADADSLGYFWRVDGSNYASLDPTTNKFTVAIGGTSYTWAIPLTWKQFDKVSLYIAAGNGAPRLIYSVARLGVAVDLGTGTTMGNAPASGTIDLFCNGTSNQVAAWLHSLKAKASGTLPPWFLGLQPAQTKQIICVGDSLTFGYGVPSRATNNYPAQLSAVAGPSWGQPINLGITGDTVANMNGSTRRAQFLASYDAFRHNDYIVWAGTNDLAATTNGEPATLASLWSLCDYLRANGGRVTVVTCLPRATITQPQATFDADRAAYNTHIRAQWASHADALADAASNATIGPDGSQSNTTYYLADLTHMTAARYALVDTYIGAALAGLPS